MGVVIHAENRFAKRREAATVKRGAESPQGMSPQKQRLLEMKARLDELKGRTK
jgi:hypothetical protein